EFPRQIVLAIRVTGTENRDVDVVASPTSGTRVALASGTSCGDGTTETGCAAQPSTAASIRLKMRNLAPGTYPLYLFGIGEGNVELRVQYIAQSVPATNLSSATALQLLNATTTSAVVNAEIVDVGKTPTSCDSAAGPLVYKVEIPES